MIYAVIAFGYQLTFQTSDTPNFGQGDARRHGGSDAGQRVNYIG
jgi:branched-subunit amino acid ABC-type transport system permease component